MGISEPRSPLPARSRASATTRYDLSNTAGQRAHDRMVSFVQSMLDLHKQLAAAKTAHANTPIQRQACPDAGRIDATDRHACPDAGRIDQLAHALYGLTDDETRIVEQATDQP